MLVHAVQCWSCEPGMSNGTIPKSFIDISKSSWSVFYPSGESLRLSSMDLLPSRAKQYITLRKSECSFFTAANLHKLKLQLFPSTPSGLVVHSYSIQFGFFDPLRELIGRGIHWHLKLLQFALVCRLTHSSKRWNLTELHCGLQTTAHVNCQLVGVLGDSTDIYYLLCQPTSL